MIFNPSALDVGSRTGSRTERRGRVEFYAGKASASARLITLSLGGATPPPATNLPITLWQGAGSARFRSCCALLTQPCRFDFGLVSVVIEDGAVK